MPSLTVQPRVPQKGTLRKYGLSPEEWLEISRTQGHVCAVCKNIPDNGRLCTDHDHVKGWKKMPPEQRKLHVRGLLCYFCNHWYVGRAINVFKAKNVLSYLEAFEKRKPTCQESKRKINRKPKRRLKVSSAKRESNGQSSGKGGKIVKPVFSVKLDHELS